MTQLPEDDTPLFAIGVAARVVGVHQQTLRNYERWGFIRPARTDGGTRAYSARDLQKIRGVRGWMSTLGVNRPGVEVLLEMVDYINDLEAKIDTLTKELAKVKGTTGESNNATEHGN